MWEYSSRISFVTITKRFFDIVTRRTTLSCWNRLLSSVVHVVLMLLICLAFDDRFLLDLRDVVLDVALCIWIVLRLSMLMANFGISMCVRLDRWL